MNIVHICLRGPYTDNWGYQENILPKCQVRLGDEIYIIAQNQKHETNGEIVETDIGEYTLDDGVNIIRIKASPVLGSERIGTKLGNYKYFEYLERICPDIVFVHGLFTGYLSSSQLKQYKKKYANTIIVTDNHEFGYGLKYPLSLKQRVFRVIRKKVVKGLLCCYDVVYCLAPMCSKFAFEYYGIPLMLIRELPLGFDDELCNIEEKEIIRNEIRKDLNIKNEDYLIVHGGKIIPRRLTDVAINSVKKVHKTIPNIKLAIFGDISPDLKVDVESLIKENSDFVIYLGHQNQEKYLKLFMAADIGLFPGAPSALWQEAIGCELFLALCNGNDSEYLNRDNNVVFTQPDVDSVAEGISLVISNKMYDSKVNTGIREAKNYFSYNKMAKDIRKLGLKNDKES